ncbi:alginate O-acetyltransferase [Marinobacter sp. F4218]|uniref:alginate O-acetyltransferase n=1 Tax=Marinobacter sp. F4218 TaxID=2862868 RepID=UPI001C62C8FA|nr:alginate O-acetyltransferase [Marinobacter sp. F4218]MBW7470395.1 alginate O-acetyltransferase [Marinobacter sp. F4218]
MSKAAKHLTVTAFIVIVLVPGLMALAPLKNYEAPEQVDPIAGDLARDLEAHYDQSFPVREFGTNLWAAIRYNLFGEARKGAVVGREGWLFTAEEFYPPPNQSGEVEANLQRIAHLVAYLEQQGIPVVLMVVPAKARVYEDKLANGKPAPQMQSLYPRILQHVEGEQVLVPDVLEGLQAEKSPEAPLFLKTDTHWTPRGADVFARQMAEQITKTFPSQDWHQAEYITREREPQSHRGDLLNFIPVTPYLTALGPEPDWMTPHLTEPAEATTGGLFGGKTPRVTLVGTSYSANPLWNFDGALRQHLGADLINVADEGHGPFEPMVAYLRSQDFREYPPELVLWEFPERYLVQPVDSESVLGWFEQTEEQMANVSNRRGGVK